MNNKPALRSDHFPTMSESEKTVLHTILRSHRLSQPDIVRQTGLSQQSISRIVKSLLGHGILISSKMATGGRGQPSIAVQLSPKFAYTFGVSIMTDAFSVICMDLTGNVLDEKHCEMPNMDRRNAIPKINETIELFIEKQKIKRQNILGVGVGISGYCLGGHGRYNTPSELDDWALIDLNDILSEQLNFPVLVENDANAAAIGESMLGAGRTLDNFVYIYVSTGIGGGVIINQELMRGCHGNGGEIGLILPNKGQHAPTLESLTQHLIDKGVAISSLHDLLHEFDINWPGIDEWVDDTQYAFSLITSSLAAILDTQAIIMGGRIPKILANKVIQNIDIYDDARRAEPRPKPRLMVSELNNAGTIGAAALPFKKHFFSPTA